MPSSTGCWPGWPSTGPEILVAHEAQNVFERRLRRLLQECEERVAKQVLHPRTPCIRPSLLEDLQHAGGDQRSPARRDRAEWIVSETSVGAPSIEVSDLRVAECRVHARREVAMWVDKPGSSAAIAAIKGCSKKCRFPGAAPPNHVRMLAARSRKQHIASLVPRGKSKTLHTLTIVPGGA